MILVLHNNKQGNNCLVANIIKSRLNCESAAAVDFPSLENFDIIIFVVPNTGDEELPQPMEDYLFNLKTMNKKYVVCELGNYFGFENYCGCKKIVFKILDSLGWERISDISIDSLPTLDSESLEKWLDNTKLLYEFRIT